MAVAGDIVGISIPFAAGVLAAAVLQPGGTEIYLWALGCSVCLAALCVAHCAPGNRTGLTCLLFFALGAFCYCSAKIRGGSGSVLPAFTANALRRFTALIDGIDFPHEDTGPLLKALLTGQRTGLSRSVTESFRASGASHILALSGLHLGVIYGLVGKVLSVFGRSRAAYLIRSVVIIGICGFYAMMTGASPSIVRAFLFIVLNEFARLSPGRRRRPLNIYCASLTIQLAANPPAIESTGFQLSYLAMLGIFLLYPRLEAWYPGKGRFDPARLLWTSAALSISCQAFTAPAVWWKFHTFPTYFLLTNLIALPLTEALIPAGLLTVALSAAGICPQAIKNLADALSQALIFCLETIAGL